MRNLDSFKLKIIAIVCMALDHIYTYIIRCGIDIPVWFGYLGKIASPIFFYLIVEGFFYTKSRRKYIIRLASFGVIMIGIDKILKIHNNIFLSLTLAVILMSFLECIKEHKEPEKRVISIIAAIGTGVLFMFTEASVYGLGMTLIFYFCRNKKLLMSVLYMIFSILPIISVIGSPQMYEQLFLFDYQWMMILALPLILMYNGKLGLKNTFTKWMFYIFYPAHLIIIILISRALS